MKKTKKIIVLRDKKDGAYLKNYKNNDDSMACTSHQTICLSSQFKEKF